MNEWIDAKDRPPEGKCLVMLKRSVAFNKMHTANFTGNVKTVGGMFSFDMPEITHWMPLPKPPEDQQ